MKRNERIKNIRQNTEFSNSGRISGNGMVEDDYSENGGRPNYEARYKNKTWITGTTEEDMEAGPVVIIRKADKK